jgi:ferredoxin-thioredoxin reductase catalytic subunit
VTDSVTKAQQKRFQVIDLAIARGWFINPSKGMEVFIENIIKIGRCPCDRTRPDCPCPESEIEVATKGHCRCALYWKNYQAFRDTLRPLKGEEDERKTKGEIRPAHPGRAKK